MSRKIYDLAVKTGEYEKEGQKKNRYQNVGAVIEKDDGGKFILLEKWFNPAGVEGRGGSIIVSMFEPRNRQQGGGFGQQEGDRPQEPRPQYQGPENFEDDIQF